MAKTLFTLLILLFYVAVAGAQQTIFVPTCSGVNDTSRFTSIISTIGTNQGTIRLPYKAGSRCAVNSITIPSNITLDNTDGTGIKVNTGQTLIINGPRVNPPGKTLVYNVGLGQGSVVYGGATYQANNDGGVPLTPQMFGPPNVPIGDGASRALSTVYSTLPAAMAVYPFITSLTQTVDYAAIQKMSYEALGYPTTGAAVAYTNLSPGTTDSVMVDNTASYPVNSLTGRILNFRYANDYVIQRVIASNTATTITLATPIEYTIGGTVCGYLSVPGNVRDCVQYGIVAQQEHGASLARLNKPMYLPAGTYMLGSSFWSIKNGVGVSISGQGALATVIQGTGDSVFRTDGIWYLSVKDLEFQSTAAGTATVDIDGCSAYPCASFPLHTYATRGVQQVNFKNVLIEAGGSSYAFALTRLGNISTGAQGSNVVFDNCKLNSSSVAGYYSQGFNALANIFWGGDFIGNQKDGIYINAGSIAVYGTSFESTNGYQQVLNDGYDINANTGGVSDRIIVSGSRSESLRFYRGAASQPPILIGNNTLSYGGDAGWFANTAGYYTLNKSVIKTSATQGPKLYVVTTAGTSGAVEPTWPDSGTVADGSVVWTQVDYYAVDLSTAGQGLSIGNTFNPAGMIRFGSWALAEPITVNTAAALTIRKFDTPSRVIFCDTTSTNQTITLLRDANAPIPDGTRVTIKKVTTDANTVTLAYSGGNGGEAVTLAGGSTGYVTLQFAANAGITQKWWIIGRNP